MTHDFSHLLAFIDKFLRHEITGQQIVNAIDEFVSSDKVYDLPDTVANNTLDLQNQAAMYVANPEKRLEYSGYFDDSKLTEILVSFLRQNKN
jgi:hypothetical protein